MLFLPFLNSNNEWKLYKMGYDMRRIKDRNWGEVENI